MLSPKKNSYQTAQMLLRNFNDSWLRSQAPRKASAPRLMAADRSFFWERLSVLALDFIVEVTL